MEHWTYPDEESGPQLVIGDASALKAHAHLLLAASFTMGSSSELQLVTKMSGDHTAIVIILNEDLWSDAGHLEIVGYEAESYDGKLIFNNFASLTCQIFWSKSLLSDKSASMRKEGHASTRAYCCRLPKFLSTCSTWKYDSCGAVTLT